jgi:hypothetical protein
MKNTRNFLKIVLTTLVINTIPFSCKKQLFDYRNKYTGDYDFTYSYSSWIVNQGTVSSGTSNYSGKVYYDKKSEGVIKINYEANTTLELNIDRNGNLTLLCGVQAGKFESKNKVTLNYGTGSCAGSGMGGGSNYSVTGIKK